MNPRDESGGMFLGGADDFFLGKYRGTSQNGLSKRAVPPGRAPHIPPMIFWLIGFFILIAFAG